MLAVLACAATAADEAALRESIQQQINLTQSYLGSEMAGKIAASPNARARQLLEEAKEFLARGRRDFEQGNLEAAKKNISLALRRFTAAGTANTRSEDQAPKLSREIESTRAEIDSYLVSFNSALAEKGPSMAGLLDQQYVADLLVRAEQMRSNGDYESAKSLLDEARQNVVMALVKIRSNETVVYSLEFQTPADEFRYESERFREYQMLGRKVLSDGDFAQSRIKLFEQLRQQGEELSQEASALASRGDYATAISRMEEAVKKIVRGLRVLGVPLSM
ncbi:MAG: hypothetical protein JSU95_02925 [Betaproteobacteria bacterium]|nr:MAG: hypothetical protein JSU95_02925 [Betaproteobacteria bacterium]